MYVTRFYIVMYRSITNMCYLMWQNLNIPGKGIAEYIYIYSFLAGPIVCCEHEPSVNDLDSELV